MEYVLFFLSLCFTLPSFALTFWNIDVGALYLLLCCSYIWNGDYYCHLKKEFFTSLHSASLCVCTFFTSFSLFWCIRVFLIHKRSETKAKTKLLLEQVFLLNEKSQVKMNYSKGERTKKNKFSTREHQVSSLRTPVHFNKFSLHLVCMFCFNNIFPSLLSSSFSLSLLHFKITIMNTAHIFLWIYRF